MESQALEAISQIIRARRSIKPFDMDPTRTVDRGLLLTLLENANWAPTHGLTEPWRFAIFQGEGRKELSETMQRIYRETTPPTEFREDKMKKMSENPLLASAVLVIWMERRGGDKIPQIEEIEATACAVQNLHLSACAAGLAGYWSTPPLLGTRAFGDWLGIREQDLCLGLFYLGWPKPGFVWPKGVRQPIDGKLTWHGEAS